MKKLLFIAVMLTTSFFGYTQVTEVAMNEVHTFKKAELSLSPMSLNKKFTEPKKLKRLELQASRGSLFRPKVSANIYLSEKYILRVIAPTISLRGIRDLVDGSDVEVSTFLEYRNYKTPKAYLSYGPAVGVRSYTTNDFEEGLSRTTEGRVGFNFGGGYRASNHLTVGTYINPYMSFSEDGVQLNQGRLFAGMLTNIYVAYRF